MKTILILAVLHFWHPHWPHWHHKAPAPVVVVKPAPKHVVRHRAVSCRDVPALAYQYPEAYVLPYAQQRYRLSAKRFAHLKWCLSHPGVPHGK